MLQYLLKFNTTKQTPPYQTQHSGKSPTTTSLTNLTGFKNKKKGFRRKTSLTNSGNWLRFSNRFYPNNAHEHKPTTKMKFISCPGSLPQAWPVPPFHILQNLDQNRVRPLPDLRFPKPELWYSFYVYISISSAQPGPPFPRPELWSQFLVPLFFPISRAHPRPLVYTPDLWSWSKFFMFFSRPFLRPHPSWPVPSLYLPPDRACARVGRDFSNRGKASPRAPDPRPLLALPHCAGSF